MLVCPDDQHSLKAQIEKESDSEWLEGVLVCEKCSKSYEIVDGIPRFVPKDHYTASFGYQWTKFAKTQLDSNSGLDISRSRFKLVCDWELPASGWGLEVGCGSGRFTEIAKDMDMDWVSVDPSIAIEANHSNNGRSKNVHCVQADLYHLPFKPQSFDKCFCLGVLQHTPHPKASYLKLLEQIKKEDSELCIDVYTARWDNIFWSKYWFRLFTPHIPKPMLLKIITKLAPGLIFIHDLMRFIPWAGRYLAHRLVPVCNYKYSYPLNKQQNLEWAILDTFDMLSPTYDIPKSLEEVKIWMEEVSPKNYIVNYGPNGVVARLCR